jgi:hypothetical protein
MKAMEHDPALADIVMLSQINDCGSYLGLWTGTDINNNKGSAGPNNPDKSIILSK